MGDKEMSCEFIVKAVKVLEVVVRRHDRTATRHHGSLEVELGLPGGFNRFMASHASM